jgi:histidinol-phosphate aminotransferase
MNPPDTAPPASPPQHPEPRPEVMKIAAYVGGEGNIEGVNRVIKLSSNEGAFGPPPGAVAAYTKTAAEIFRYPDGGSGALRTAIGRHHGLDPARIVCGTGSDELIGHLCHIYGGAGTDILMSMHAFTMYQIAGTYAGSRVIKVPEKNLTTDVDAMLANVTEATRIVFVANPNNPTGSLLSRAEMERLRAGLRPDILLVLDAAYAEYVEDPDYDPGVALVDAGDNTVMLRTFSKIYGLGGMRVGWAYAPAAVIDAINRVRGVFNVNIAAQAAAVAALAEPGWVEKGRAHNIRAKAKLSAALERAGIKVWPSHGNFFLADFATPARAKAADDALRARGLIVRAMGAYDLPHCLRITVGNDEECAMVADALTAFMATQKLD